LQYQLIQQGDDNGNGMIVKFRLPSGLEIFSLPTKNHYGGHWDLGPTWNYAVMADEPFLVDAGRYGQGGHLLKMIEAAGLRAADLAFVLISHGHEDHDGGLAELVGHTHLKVKAHAVYDLLIRQYPSFAPRGNKQHFPAKCWHCFMPETFYTQNCLPYHGVLQSLKVETVGDGGNPLGTDMETWHLPGHAPDSLVVALGDEGLIVGDVLLPDITPWPTCVALYQDVSEILAPTYPDAKKIYGLLRYIRSLGQLKRISQRQSAGMVFPAHRLFYQGEWRTIDIACRIEALLEHHVQRCAAILDILRSGPKTAEQIAREHFEASLLEGFGHLMAANEINSHCELMLEAGDLLATEDGRYMATGASGFEALIHSAATPSATRFNSSSPSGATNQEAPYE
jgi:glyoxylase-like metal-dependent hydrolase (beta-lactamase superfamily II)